MAEPKAWITVRGRRVPIYDGESKADAVKRMTNKDARVKKKVDETFTSSREAHDKSHAKEIEASKAKQRSKAEDNLAGLRAELKKHPNDEHTEYIKKRIKAAEDRVKESGGSSKATPKQQKAAELARRQLDFDRPGDYAEITDNEWRSRVGLSNEKMADLMSSQDSKYDYEYKREETKGSIWTNGAKVIHHRMYRIPK